MKPSCAPRTHRPAPTARGKALLLCALAFQLSLVVSLRTGLWERWTFDSTATHGRLGWDFYALYQAGHNLLSGVSAYESDDHRIEVVVPRHTPYRYLPFPAYTLGLVASLVRAPLAYGLWVAVLEALLIGCAAAAWRLAGGGDRGAALASAWLLFSPVYLELYLGQFSLVQAAWVLLGLWAADTAAPPRAPLLDAAWALSLLWKQNTALWLPVWVRHRRWRTLGRGGLAVFLLSAPYFALYPEALRSFAANLVSGPPSPHLGNLGARQLLYSLTSAVVPAPEWAGHALAQWALMALVVILSLRATWRDGSADLVAPLCLWTVNFFLLYHDVWEHHYVLLLPVYTALLARHPARELWLLLAVTALWTPYRLIDLRGLAAVDASMRWTPLEPRGLDILYHASKAAPALLLWAWLLRLVSRGDRHPSRSPS